MKKVLYNKQNLVSNKENKDSSTPQGKLMLTMIDAIYEFEYANLLERQREGIATAKANDVYKGRKEIDIPNEKWNVLYAKYMNREINKVQFAKELDVTRVTLDKLLVRKTGKK